MSEKKEADRSRLGAYIKKARQDLNMSLRDVESATGKEVSNAYLSQLESGKILKPSPHVLFSLSSALRVPYEELMTRAGYIAPEAGRSDAVDNRSEERRVGKEC